MLHFTPIFLSFSLCAIVAADVNITAWNTQIIWPPATNSTPAWTPTESRCSPTGDGHFAFQRNMSVSYEFTGVAIYIALLRSNVTSVYTFSVDGGDPVLIDGYHNPTICDQMLGQSGLSFGPHTATIDVYGASPQAGPLSPGANVYLEIDGFVYTTPNGSTSSSISPSSTSPASTNPASASHSPLKGSAIAGIVVASVAFVGAIIVSLFFFLRRRNGRGNLNLEYRPTIIDRDSIHSAHVSHFLPPPAASSESQSGESSAMAVIDTKYTASPASRAITLRTSQTTSVNGPPPHGTQPQNTSVTEFQLQDLTNRVPAPGTHVAQQTHATGRNTEDHDAPPQYDS